MSFLPKNILSVRGILRLIAKMEKYFPISLHLYFSSLTQKFGREQDNKKILLFDTLWIFLLPNHYVESKHNDLLGKLGKDNGKLGKERGKIRGTERIQNDTCTLKQAGF